jgi:hypothetical protein
MRMRTIRVPHRGQLGQASTAGGVAVIVAIVTSDEKIGGSTTVSQAPAADIRRLVLCR